MTLYTIGVVFVTGANDVLDVRAELLNPEMKMPYTTAEDFADRCNRDYGAAGRYYKTLSPNQVDHFLENAAATYRRRVLSDFGSPID